MRAEKGSACSRLVRGNKHCAKVGTRRRTLNQPDGLLDRSTDGQVVDGDLPGDALGVDEEQTSEGDPVLGQEDAVLGRHRVVLVRELTQWKLAVLKSVISLGEGGGEERRRRTRGILRLGPRPPSGRERLAQARWDCTTAQGQSRMKHTSCSRSNSRARTYSESVETASNSVFSALNWGSARSNARISVGQTKVNCTKEADQFSQVHDLRAAPR